MLSFMGGLKFSRVLLRVMVGALWEGVDLGRQWWPS
jgi:hypothetical protein